MEENAQMRGFPCKEVKKRRLHTEPFAAGRCLTYTKKPQEKSVWIFLPAVWVQLSFRRPA
jgi:hypothetical protein